MLKKLVFSRFSRGFSGSKRVPAEDASCVDLATLVGDSGYDFDGTEFCVAAPNSAFIVAGSGLTICNETHGMETANAFGAAFGSYYISGNAQTLRFYEIQMAEVGMTILNTKSNWEGAISYRIKYSDRTYEKINMQSMIIFNPNQVTVNYETEGGCKVYIDGEDKSEKGEEKSITLSTLQILPNEELPEEGEEGGGTYKGRAQISISGNSNIVPEKIIILNPGTIFSDGMIDSTIPDYAGQIGLSPGMIAAITMAAVLVVGIIVTIIVCCCMKAGHCCCSPKVDGEVSEIDD